MTGFHFDLNTIEEQLHRTKCDFATAARMSGFSAGCLLQNHHLSCQSAFNAFCIRQPNIM